MSSVGSGVGGSIGVPNEKSVTEIDTTAAVNFAKAAMKIVTDTSEVCFFLLESDVRKYQSSANRPVLAPLIEVRVATTEQPATDKFSSIYNDLLSLLPEDFQDYFKQVQLLPKAKQPRDMQILDHTLQKTAKWLSWLTAASADIPPESLAAARTKENILRPYLALNSVIQDSLVYLSQIRSYLELAGPNSPNFDAIIGYTEAFTPLMEELKVGLGLLQDSSKQIEGRTLLAGAASKLAVLEDQFNRLYSGSELLILGSALHAARVAAEALSMEKAGSAALAIMLANASLGIRQKESRLGIVGSNLNSIYEAFAQGVQQATGNKLSGASASMLSQFATLAFTSLQLFGHLNYDTSTVGANQKEYFPSAMDEKNFGYGMLLTILTQSNLLPGISNFIMQATEAQGPALSLTSKLLLGGLLLSLISTSVSGQNFSSATPLLQSQQASLKETISAAEKLVGNGLSAGTLSGENAENLNVYLKQASIALDQEDYDAFQSALTSSLLLSGASLEGTIKDFKETKTIANAMAESANVLANNNTGIIIAA